MLQHHGVCLGCVCCLVLCRGVCRVVWVHCVVIRGMREQDARRNRRVVIVAEDGGRCVPVGHGWTKAEVRSNVKMCITCVCHICVAAMCLSDVCITCVYNIIRGVIGLSQVGVIRMCVSHLIDQVEGRTEGEFIQMVQRRIAMNTSISYQSRDAIV